MNEKRFLLIILILSAMAFMTGCEYEVAQPKWYDKQENPPAPEITQVVPADVAGAGVNTITINGNNFAESFDRNRVYFDNTPVDILSASTTNLTVRRPNLVSDNCTIKVVSYDAIEVAQFSPYQVTSVWEKIGNFPENLKLNAITVDPNENVYVFQNSPRTIYKFAPTGEMTELGEAAPTVTDAKYAKLNGIDKLILFRNNRSIDQIDLSVDPPEETELVQVSKRVSYGDFDSNGYLYTAGKRTDLIQIGPDLTTKPALGTYANDDITGVRVYNGYLYLVVNLANPAEGEPESGIWRHQILNTEADLGERELVLDWSTTGEYASSTIQDITFSADGTMYIATDNENPFLILKPDQSLDVLYKTILPSYPAKIEWGTGNSLYMVLGGDEWNVVRIEMGDTGAPYYGRTL